MRAIGVMPFLHALMSGVSPMRLREREPGGRAAHHAADGRILRGMTAKDIAEQTGSTHVAALLSKG